ncbi:sigma-54-dependent Fis family transcriptional regulator [Candidatus Methylospira mobilis]|uniref:Sigma-54-dependent Fis family transcriptional regulator n=1 Tax=Candidatus Methylospira mobilis TaxID=1808979 RepID=A0A5Q0BFX9_9GAMM|nr:sigma-54 dependent transcriptional regulator [Candidatus Methylospira mobilis]QFY42753.1 sigma-54-dependent Fis family transcriptional regulator [Candidatus Methylospira mobilis]WNV04122.1 sigma-54 dependent transcriptional regulator [Candidatus Methylospira mobilis]
MEPTLPDNQTETLHQDQHAPVLTFPEPRSMTLSIRASALVFEDPSSRQLLDHVERIAPSDATVLIIGETGTGKELIARHIHALSARHNKPFGALNCAALTESLIESELFGHEKGAFTGAVGAKDGWFETSNGGTLFLDEVGDLPLGMQAKLLRVLQEREVVRVGARRATPIDVRVIAATNVNLEEAVEAGRFRADLYYRFNVANVQLIPLRERPGDILPLTRHFMGIYGKRLGYTEARLAPEAERTLLDYDWPGNIRELENAIHRALLICPGDVLRSSDFKLSGLKPQISTPASSTLSTISTSSLENAVKALCEQSPPKLFELIEETIIRTAFDYCEQNQVQTARLLDISRNVLRHRLTIYGMLLGKQQIKPQEPAINLYTQHTGFSARNSEEGYCEHY